MKHRFVGSLLLACGVAFWPVADDSAKAGAVTIRMATVAPNSSKPMRILRAWDNSVQKETGGQVRFQFYGGGIAGDERDVLRKMRVGQLDATTFTSVGLSQIVRSAAVLQMPGIFDSYADLGAVRAEMSDEWNSAFREGGYQLLGWFDVGFGRVFSKKKIEGPTDLKKMRPWVWRDDPVYPQLMDVIGANGVKMGLPEVFPGLQTGMIDTVVTAPVAALALQWFRHVGYMSKQADMALVGATIIRKETFDALAPDAQEAVLETAKKAHAHALHLVQSEEVAAVKALKDRGVVEVDQGAHEKEWSAAYDKLKTRLSGKLFSAELLKRVEAAADKAGG